MAGVELPEAARPVRAVEGSCSAVTVSVDLPCLLAAAREPVLDCSRWSSSTKSVRVVGWVRRFYGNARSAHQDRRCGGLSVAEIESARLLLLREEQRQAFSAEYRLLQQGKTVPKSLSVHQLTPFLGDDGLLRIRRRLQQSELPFEERHPILLPNGRVAELLVRDQHRLMSHCGVATLITAVRTSYWVVGLRCLAKRIKRFCVSCQRQDAVACNEPAAPLSRDRVTRAPPFTVTGDFERLRGTDFRCRCRLPVRSNVCLFTCAVTRAVHLELTSSLTQSEFLMAETVRSEMRSSDNHLFG